MTLLAIVGQDYNAPHDSTLTLWLHDAEQDDFILVKASRILRPPSYWAAGEQRHVTPCPYFVLCSLCPRSTRFDVKFKSPPGVKRNIFFLQMIFTN